MSRQNARDTVDEFGIEEGDTLLKGRKKSSPGVWVVEILAIESNTGGPAEYKVEITCNGKTIEDNYSVEDIASWVRGGWIEHVQDPLGESDSDESDEPEIVTDGGVVVDDDGHEIDDYPERADENEALVGLNEWGAWYYDSVLNRLHNYKRIDNVPEEMVLEETDGACEELSGVELAERIADLDIITERGYKLIYDHAPPRYVVNALQHHGLTPAQSWAYYGVVLEGNSRNKWADELGHSDHSAVSQAVRKAKEKIPR